MKKLLLSLAAMSVLVFISCERKETVKIENPETDLVASTSQVIEGKYVVLFEDQGLLKSAAAGEKVSAEAVRQTTRNIFAAVQLPYREPDFVYSSAVRGIAVEMNSTEAARLQQAEGVKGVYPDMMVTLKLPSILAKPAPAPVAESTPWGITRIGGSISGIGKTAWIIDTGIDLDHPDLTVSTTKGYNFIANTQIADDDNGHGSHCAGIVAAKDNDIGVIGVAAGATVVPVKVLDRRGSGAYSVIIAGVDFVALKALSGDAANMSLGGPGYVPLDEAILRLAAKGIKVSLAAGNESQNANNVSPARVNGVGIYTVSAMATGDKWASYSNFGNPPVDYCAPGSSIYSTYKGGAYATLSGTSMAAPHVCGLLLLGTVKTSGTVIGDPDGNPDLIAHN